ncbi:MAG: hypothetical protein AABX64_01580 [Nanoarchaeota archaeon]
MTQPTTLDERIFAALEKTIDYFAENIPRQKEVSFAPDDLETDLLAELQQKGYSKRFALAAFRCCYWYLQDEGLLTVDTLYEVKYRLNHPLTGELRSGSCFQIFAKYEKYLMVNSEEIPAYQIKSIIDLNNGEKIL